MDTPSKVEIELTFEQHAELAARAWRAHQTVSQYIASKCCQPEQRKQWKPKHERTDEVASYLSRAIANHNPKALAIKTAASSLSSRKGIDTLLSRVPEPESVLDVLDWLFGGQAGDYQPTSASFDWRTNILSGESLLRQWDRISGLRNLSVEADKR